MLGPGLALRGPEGPKSMDKSIEVLQFQSKLALIFFMLSLISFHISSLLLIWVNYSIFNAISINILLLGFLILFYIKGRQIFKLLFISDTEAVSGKFNDFAAYQYMTNLEKYGQPPVSGMVSPSSTSHGLKETNVIFEHGVLNTIKDMFT